jgi:DNA-directed RNA polymerase specialized sigma24 family protein
MAGSSGSERIATTEAEPTVAPEQGAPLDPEIQQGLDDWAKINTRALHFARKITRSRADAEDLVQDAYEIIRRGHRSWNRKRHPTFVTFVCGVILGLWGDDLRINTRRANLTSKADRGDLAPNAAPSPEDLAMEEDEHRAWDELVAALREVVRREAKDPNALPVLELWLDGADKAEEQAESLGLPIERVYAARATVRRYGDRLSEERRLTFIAEGRLLARHAPPVELEEERTMREVLAMSDEAVARGLADEGIDAEASLEVTRAIARLPVPPRPRPEELLYVERGENIWEQTRKPLPKASLWRFTMVMIVFMISILLAVKGCLACFG